MKPKVRKPVILRIRLSLPEKTGGAHGSKKGKKGYNRASGRQQLRQDL